MIMVLSFEKRGDVTIGTVLIGALDAGNSNEFKDQMMSLLGDDCHVVLDVSKLDFLDSSGLGAVLACLRKINESGKDMKLYGMTKPVRTLFEMVRMHRIVDIYNTEEEALAALKS